MRSFPTCSVPNFFSFADINIDNWIYQMETFICTCCIKEKYLVLFLAYRIHISHLEVIKPHIEKSYPYFVRELRRIFSAPDLTQARLTKLSAMSQEGDEDSIYLMKRIRQLTVKVYLKMSVEDREKIPQRDFSVACAIV